MGMEGFGAPACAPGSATVIHRSHADPAKERSSGLLRSGSADANAPATEPRRAVVRRVVFVNRYFYPDLSATSQILTDLAFHLAANGVAVTVVTGRQTYTDPKVSLPAREMISGVDVIRVKTTGFGRMRLLGRAFDYTSFYIAA